jgi:hypothetical protein
LRNTSLSCPPHKTTKELKEISEYAVTLFYRRSLCLGCGIVHSAILPVYNTSELRTTLLPYLHSLLYGNSNPQHEEESDE